MKFPLIPSLALVVLVASSSSVGAQDTTSPLPGSVALPIDIIGDVKFAQAPTFTTVFVLMVDPATPEKEIFAYVEKKVAEFAPGAVMVYESIPIAICPHCVLCIPDAEVKASCTRPPGPFIPRTFIGALVEWVE